MSKNMLLGYHLNNDFVQTNKYYTNLFISYMVILMGFSVMFISFLRKFHFFTFSVVNMIIFSIILLPLLFFIIKSLYGLIIIQTNYRYFHHKLITQFIILYFIAYNIIISSFINDAFIINKYLYFFYSTGLFLLSMLLKLFFDFDTKEDYYIEFFKHNDYAKIKRMSPIKEIVVFMLVSLGLSYLFYSVLTGYLVVNLYFLSYTYVFMLLIVYNYYYDTSNYCFNKMEIILLQQGLKEKPNTIIKDYLEQ